MSEGGHPPSAFREGPQGQDGCAGHRVPAQDRPSVRQRRLERTDDGLRKAALRAEVGTAQAGNPSRGPSDPGPRNLPRVPTRPHRDIDAPRLTPRQGFASARRRTRCTFRTGTASPSNWKPPGKRHARHVQKRIGNATASLRVAGCQQHLKLVDSMRHMGRSPLVPAASGATGNRQLEARIDTRSHPNRRWNPLGCGVADGSATTVATTREKSAECPDRKLRSRPSRR